MTRSSLLSTIVRIGLFGFLSIFPIVGFGLVGCGVWQIRQDHDAGWILVGFGGVWLLLCLFIGGTRSGTDGTRRSAEPELHAPWESRGSWVTVRVAGSAAKQEPVSWVLGLALAGVGFFLLQHSARTPTMEGRNIGLGMGLTLLLVGLVTLSLASVLRFHRRKFGVATLHLPGPPGRIGGRLVGILDLPSGVRHECVFRVRLECVRTNFTNSDHAGEEGGSESEEAHRESLWLDECRLRAIPTKTEGSIELPFTFQIPAGLPASSRDAPVVEWRVRAAASLPGMNFRESFAVPVFAAEPGDSIVHERASTRPDQAIVSSAKATGDTASFVWKGDRIEADRRLGPLWPGLPGIGLFSTSLGVGLASVPDVARRSHRTISILGILTIGGTFVGWTVDRGVGIDSWEMVPGSLMIVLQGIVWVAVAYVTLFFLGKGLRAWHHAWHLERFGLSSLRLADWPVPRGAKLSGVLQIPSPVTPENGFFFRLLCARTRWLPNRLPGPAADIGWVGDWSAFVGYDAGNEETEVPFELPTPLEQPALCSGESGGSGAWQWYVETYASVPGLNYMARFPVPEPINASFR